jgi:hypothetical protein
MVSRIEFDALLARVSHIESVLHISESSALPALPTPYTILIEQEKFTTSDDLNTKSLYASLENDYHIFVRIYIHGQIVAPKTSTKVINGFHEHMFIQNFYNVLIIKHSDLGSVGEHLWPKMNTSQTSNVHQYIDKYKRFSVFFGYSNVNEQLKEGDNLFSQGKGVFFIINDRAANNNVRNYVNGHNDEIKLVSEGLGSGEIDVYQSKSMTKDDFVVKIVSTQTPPSDSKKAEEKKGSNKKLVTKQD